MSAPNNAPHTSVQYRSPATARPTILIASTTAWPRSMSASCLKRKSRCSSANGTVLNDVMTKVALMATTTRGSCGARKKCPSGNAATTDASRLTHPTSTAKPLS